MAKRKFGASVIILCIAAVTLISGTYAWFLVGGFANLFDLGFDVIESQGGLELRGDDSQEWKETLVRDDFKQFSFIAEGGSYRPVSSANGVNFIAVGMENHEFKSNGVPANKNNAATPDQIWYNDFTFYIRSTGAEIVATETTGPYMTVELTGDKEKDPAHPEGASRAARVAVTVDGKTTIYDVDSENYNAVTSTFSDHTVVDAPSYNQIIDSAEAGSNVELTPVTVTKLTDGDGNLIKIMLGTIPANTDSTGKQISMQIWLEGNDLQCVDFGDDAVTGKDLVSKIEFHTDQ